MASDAEAEGASDLAVMEVNEYKQKRRTESILDSLDAVQQRDDELSELMAMGEITQQGRDMGVLHTVQAAIEDCRNLLLEYAKANAEKLTDGEGSDGQTHTRYADEYWHGTLDNPIGQVSFHNGGTVDIIGLKHLLGAKMVYTETWTETVSSRHRGDEEVERSATHVIPRYISKRGYRRLMRFLDEEYSLDVVFEDNELETWEYLDIEEDDITVIPEEAWEDQNE